MTDVGAQWGCPAPTTHLLGPPLGGALMSSVDIRERSLMSDGNISLMSDKYMAIVAL